MAVSLMALCDVHRVVAAIVVLVAIALLAGEVVAPIIFLFSIEQYVLDGLASGPLLGELLSLCISQSLLLPGLHVRKRVFEQNTSTQGS